MFRKNVAGIFLILMLLCGIIGCSNKIKPGQGEDRQPAVASVTVKMIKLSPAPLAYETHGTVKAKTVSVVAPKIMGMVTDIFVKAGDNVTAGQVLAALENQDSQQKLLAAEAGYREALKSMEIAERAKNLQKNTYERYLRLYEEAAISRQQLDQVQTQKEITVLDYERAKEVIDKAAANRREALAYEGYSRLTAPVAGLVSEKKIEVGSMALAGAPAITVEDTSSFLLEAYLEESMAKQIKLGMAAKVEVPAIGKTLTGSIIELVPAVDAASRAFLVKISLPPDNLRTGLYGTVNLVIGQKEALMIPERAVVNKGELTGVYVLDANRRLWYRLIRLGGHQGESVEVLTGLRDGETIVVEELDKAVDGGVVQEVRSL